MAITSTEQFANDVQTTLNGTIANSATAITVASASGFPTAAPASGTQFRIRIENEYLTVTDTSSSPTWTVTRGTEGSAAVSHNNGVDVVHVLTADGISSYLEGWQRHQVRVSRSTNASISNGSLTAILWDTESYDLPNNDQHSTVSNTTRLTCQKAGLYLVTAQQTWATSNTGHRTVVVAKNGTTTPNLGSSVSVASSDNPNGEGTLVVQDRLAVNDYLELYVFQNSGGALNFMTAPTTASGSAYFAMSRLSA